MRQHVSNFLKYKALLYELVKKDIKIKYKNSFLGILWSMLNPLLMMIVLTIIFSQLFKRDIRNFPVYVLSGRLIYSFFSESTRFAMNSIKSNNQLIRKIYIPKYIFPLSKILSSFVTFIISLVPLFFVMLFTGSSFDITTLGIIFPLTYILFISIGIGLILATITVFFRDMIHFYSIVLMVIMYMTPIFYPVDIIPEKYMGIINLNPVYPVVEMFRDGIIYNQMSSIHLHLICIGYCMFYLLTGLFVFYKKQDKFIFYI